MAGYEAATRKQIDYALTLFNDVGFNAEQRRDYINLRYAVENLDDLTRAQISEVIATLQDRRPTLPIEEEVW